MKLIEVTYLTNCWVCSLVSFSTTREAWGPNTTTGRLLVKLECFSTTWYAPRDSLAISAVDSSEFSDGERCSRMSPLDRDEVRCGLRRLKNEDEIVFQAILRVDPTYALDLFKFVSTCQNFGQNNFWGSFAKHQQPLNFYVYFMHRYFFLWTITSKTCIGSNIFFIFVLQNCFTLLSTVLHNGMSGSIGHVLRGEEGFIRRCIKLWSNWKKREDQKQL